MSNSDTLCFCPNVKCAGHTEQKCFELHCECCSYISQKEENIHYYPKGTMFNE